MSEQRISFPGIRVLNLEEMWQTGLGAFCFTAGQTSLLAMLPNNDEEYGFYHCAFNISDPGRSPCWHWDGNIEAPTLYPSLWLPGHWHGWLRNGRFESV